MENISSFVHLHNHTHYSIYDGFMSPLNMVRRAKELDMPAIAITDHGKVSGFMKFQKACKGEKPPEDKEELKKFNPIWKNSIKPIFGVEMYLSNDLSVKKIQRYHIILIAKNNIGLKNLYKLCSEAHKHTAYNFPRINFDMLKEYGEGLIVSTACLAGEFAQLVLDDGKEKAFEMAKKYKEVWGEDFYLEVMWTGIQEQKEVIKAAMECSEKLGIKIIATNDCHYVDKSKAEFQQIKKAISSRGPLKYSDPPSYYMKSQEEMSTIFKGKGEEFLKNTAEIVDKCNAKIVFGEASLPSFNIPFDEAFKEYKKRFIGRTDEQLYLRYLSYNGLAKRGLDNPRHRKRLEEELETIMFTGFDRYFLIVSEYCEWAREKNIRIGVGRGSGIGSLVLYCLGVVGLDPVKYKLNMDRFLYCEAEYHIGIGDIYSVELNPTWTPKGRGNRRREKTEQEKKMSDKLISICGEKIKQKELSDLEKDRIKEELRFILGKPSLVEDLFRLAKHKKEIGKLGDCNKCNSFLLELLGLTTKKAEIRLNFVFEYIVDKKQSRISPPDIDVDFEHREAILNHVCHLYGDDKVALIGTCQTFKPKAAVQFSAKVLDVTGTNNTDSRRFSSENDQEGKRLSKIMTNLDLSLKQWLGEDPKFKPPNKRIEECIEKMKVEKKRYPKVYEAAAMLEGVIKSYGTHAAGVVISSRPITDDVPLHIAKVQRDNLSDVGLSWDDDISVNTNLMTTQYDMNEVESLGLLKFDFLQLNNLRQISLTLDLIKKRYGDLDFDIDKLETDDSKVFKTIDQMKLEGLFQISGDAFIGRDYPIKDKETGAPLKNKDGSPRVFHSKGVMEIIGCSCFDDVVASNAIGRPGPLALDVPEKYAEGKNDPDSIIYPHPLLETILKDTYGVLCYQEQLIKMSQILAGFTFSEADGLRKACAKKVPEMLDLIEPKFRAGCKKNNISETVINEMWNQCIEFGSYAFNLAHSVGYGYITYQTAYLKTYYPAEFICSLLSSAAVKNDKKLEIVKSQLKKEYPKIEIIPPQINKSCKTYIPDVSKKGIHLIAPFYSIKGVGQKVSDMIVEVREDIGSYHSMDQFLRNVNSGGKTAITSSVCDTLIHLGVFRELGTESEVREEMKRYESIKKIVSKGKKNFSDPTISARIPSLF